MKEYIESLANQLTREFDITIAKSSKLAVDQPECNAYRRCGVRNVRIFLMLRLHTTWLASNNADVVGTVEAGAFSQPCIDERTPGLQTILRSYIPLCMMDNHYKRVHANMCHLPRSIESVIFADSRARGAFHDAAFPLQNSTVLTPQRYALNLYRGYRMFLAKSGWITWSCSPIHCFPLVS